MLRIPLTPGLASPRLWCFAYRNFTASMKLTREAKAPLLPANRHLRRRIDGKPGSIVNGN